MVVSIVIPNSNRADALPLTLEALIRQTYPADSFEVIVVDQDSSDGSRELILGFSSEYNLILIEQDGRYGPSIARNAGAEVAEGQIIIFLDSDIIPEIGMIEAHVAIHNKFEKPILACGRVLPYLPAYRTNIERLVNPDAGLDRGTNREEFPFYWVFSNHLSTTKKAFEEIGKFDTTLRANEDIEFGYRATLKGFKIKNCKDAIAYHNHPQTLSERFDKARTYSSQLSRVYAKHPEMRGCNPYVRSFEEIRLHSDSFTWTVKKVFTRIYSFVFFRMISFLLLRMLEIYPFSTPLANFLYYRLIRGYSYLGFREGDENLERNSKML